MYILFNIPLNIISQISFTVIHRILWKYPWHYTEGRNQHYFNHLNVWMLLLLSVILHRIYLLTCLGFFFTSNGFFIIFNSYKCIINQRIGSSMIYIASCNHTTITSCIPISNVLTHSFQQTLVAFAPIMVGAGFCCCCFFGYWAV